jgi:PTH1 family peptidyl-tRNA hydrolase
MKLIIGLGNPGYKYSKTRHNIGFRIIDEIANQRKFRVKKQEKEALTGSFHLQGDKVILAKPQTYMNNSGLPVRKLIDWYNIDVQDILIIYDDLDLKVGQMRIKRVGGHGGHNGMKSIFKHMNTNQIPRIRIGIGRPPEYMTVSDYVLGKFTKTEKKEIKKVVTKASKAVETILSQGLEKAMNDYN